MTTIVRSAEDPTRKLGEKVQAAIAMAVDQGGSVQISVEDADAGLVFVTVRPWARRG